MKILILGAGAIGGYYGARLIQAGADVTFLVRPQRAALLATHGLMVHSELGDFHAPVQTVTQDAVHAEYDAIIVTCKGYDLGQAMDAIAPAVGQSTAILPFLNGLGAYDRLDHRFGKDHVLGGIAYIATMLGENGAIRHMGANDVVITGARTPLLQDQAEALHALFAASPGARTLSGNITQALWDKWVMIAAGALMTCLMRGTVADIMAAPGGRSLMQRAITECRSVATAEGFDLSPETVQRMEKLLLDEQSSWAASMMRDITQDITRLESDDILGNMAERAEKYSLDVPLLRAAYCQLKVYESQKQRA
ncbi:MULTISPECIES: ketopantoate reductase family protein [unclassified Janthinobacterium]|uniref:ketopantoate reductase family protein n=1 Tax=unclassified Janthinobacterium TaxID=2610881 RepID=UPI00160967BC|nr:MULTISPECIES: 2-dehydropantoate 2-reductase [unclassified Janthinobacterium]MBB5606354.1 2-dehydropantoate 2-reductase [Janthinobacterium sp. S3T4]MBB5611774.1 2-dehydropantoate 2-reductase [Janthinobacterium sp. S3M3]